MESGRGIGSGTLPSALRGLLRAEAYPHPVAGIELLETQLSWILDTGERTYKLKRPIQYPFVDQRRLVDRQRLCFEELRLNRRFTPQLYLDVQPVTVVDGAACIGGDGVPIEYAVVMRSFDRREQLDQLVINGRLRDGELAAFGGWLAQLHRELIRNRGTHPPVRPDQLARAVARNAEEAIAAAGIFSTGPEIAELASGLAAEVALREPDVLRRADAGLLCECHADLHLSNIVRLDGRLRVFDCLEFDPELRWIDPAQDLAFLYADLLGFDAPHLAHELLNAYLAESGDYHAATVLRLYTADRALVRAKVMALRAAHGIGTGADGGSLLRLRHERYLRVARTALQPQAPLCVAMTGLPGSGKSWLAARLGTHLGAVVVRSDLERKRLAGLDALEPSHSGINAGLYDDQRTEAVYRQLMRHAADVLSGQRGVIIDANFGKRSQRAMIASLCRLMATPLIFCQCEAPAAVLRQRIVARQATAQDPSEADLAILELQLREREPIIDDERLHVASVDTTRDDALAVALCGIPLLPRGKPGRNICGMGGISSVLPETATRRAELRRAMVERQVVHRGVRDLLVLEALVSVPREAFVPEAVREFAYEDTPLPIDQSQTISQPYIVALMTEALQLKGGERVLEVGTGSGYAAAVLARIAREVYTVERHGQLATKAANVLIAHGYMNVHVLHGDGTLGWPEHAPFDAIVVAAGGPSVPESLKTQLKVGGRLVIPVGADQRLQELLRITRLSEHDYQTEELADVRFVPLVGKEGWESGKQPSAPPSLQARAPTAERDLAQRIAHWSEHFDDIDSVDLKPLLARIGDARVVLLGEATHGTSEFYRMRARISRELIERCGFSFIAIEGDWPDAARVDHYVRHAEYQPSEWTAFARFPVWMWRNGEVRGFVDWLREHNAQLATGSRVAFHGLDLYSLYASIESVLQYLDRVDPHTARVARLRYGCLAPWQTDPATYGHAALTGSYRSCEKPVVSVLQDLRSRQQAYAEHDGERFLDAVQNAQLVTNAERYYRTMYYGSRASWNLRDQHMFDTLKTLLDFHGPHSKGIVWAHNSHVGDSAATEMTSRGEFNLGHLCREHFGMAAYLVGFGTNSGTVAAASDWDGPMLSKSVQPALPDSYEHLCHESGVERFLLHMRNPPADKAFEELLRPRLERAIGVIYRPETELQSHYFEAVLPRQFDEYIWFDRTRAVTALGTEQLQGLPDTYPFGL